jgi:hypothetical protein
MAEFDFAAYANRLMAAGEAVAQKLRDIDSSPWTEQVLAEWQEAKDVRDWLPDAGDQQPPEPGA